MTVADLDGRMTYREYVEWCAHIRLECDEQNPAKKADQGMNWQTQKLALLKHMELVKGK
jgi:hypothetical protein